MMQENGTGLAEIYCTVIGGPLGGPFPAPCAVMLLVPYDEIRPPPTGLSPVVLLVICVCEMRTVGLACAVIPCPLVAVTASGRFSCVPPVALPSGKTLPAAMIRTPMMPEPAPLIVRPRSVTWMPAPLMMMPVVPAARMPAVVLFPSMVIDFVIVTAPKPPGSSASISPPAAVFEMAPAKVLHGAVRLHGFASSPTPDTHVRVCACTVEEA